MNNKILKIEKTFKSAIFETRAVGECFMKGNYFVRQGKSVFLNTRGSGKVGMKLGKVFLSPSLLIELISL